MLADDETETYWDHITGEAVHGPLQGKKLNMWSISLTTVEAALEKDPSLILFRSNYRSILSFLAKLFSRNVIHRKGSIPPGFRKTMWKVDERLPEMTQGLGVLLDKEARFYPMKQISTKGFEDDWNGRMLFVKRGEADQIPFAEWKDDSSRPFQMLSRWYGFVATFPYCKVFQSKTKSNE